MGDQLKGFCHESDRTMKVEMIAKLLSYHGGMYMSENTLMLNFDQMERSQDFVLALEPDTLNGYMIVTKGLVTGNRTHVQVCPVFVGMSKHGILNSA